MMRRTSDGSIDDGDDSDCVSDCAQGMTAAAEVQRAAQAAQAQVNAQAMVQNQMAAQAQVQAAQVTHTDQHSTARIHDHP